MSDPIAIQDTARMQEIRNRAGRVQARTVEPGTDHEAYELTKDVQYLLGELHDLAQAHAQSIEDYNALRNRVRAVIDADDLS